MKKIRFLTAALCAVILMFSFSISAFAFADPDEDEAPAVEEVTAPVEEAEPVEEEPAGETTGGLDWEGLDPADLKPLTPAGTGTVVGNVTSSDGKEFYTITTADESVFYLVIDRQRETENVYFLNVVTVSDLLSLAESNGESVAITPTPLVEPDPQATPAPETEPEPQPEAKGNNNMGTLLLALAVVVIGGAAGWYFKIYKPKQEQAAEVEDDYIDEAGPDYGGEDYDTGDYESSDYDSGDYDGEDGDDGPPWDEDGEADE